MSHVKCAKHQKSKEKLMGKEARERDLAQSLAKHDAQTHRKGETLTEEHKVYRVKVVMALMQAGIPLAKLECPRSEGSFAREWLSANRHEAHVRLGAFYSPGGA